MKQVLCAKCKKRPAMFFVTKVEGEKTTQEGLCIKCAMEMNIGPVKQIMQSMGISEDELEEVGEQFEAMFGEDGCFEPGGAGTLPFLQNLGAMGNPTEKEKILAKRALRGEYYYPATHSLWFYAPGVNNNCKQTWYNQAFAGKYKNPINI